MKTHFLFLLLFLTGEVAAQDTLVLRVNSLSEAGIILSAKAKTGEKKILKRENDSFTAAEPWILKIDKKTPDSFQVVVSSNTANQTVSDFDKPLIVGSGKLGAANFSISNNLSISVNKNGLIKKYNLSYNKTDSGNLGREDEATDYAVGSSVYDAFYLKNGQDVRTKIRILAYYADVDAKKELVEKAYAQNKYIKPLFTDINRAFAQANVSLGSLSSIFSSVGGLDVTQLADGLTKFLVKRTKEELNVAFFSNFRDLLNNKDFVDLRTVFPQTYRSLQIIGNEIYNYERYIQTLRESFKNDLDALTTNLPTIIDNHPDFFKKYPELESVLRSSLYVAEGLRDEVHPGQILEDFPSSYLDGLRPEWKGSMQTLLLFSTSLKDSTRSSNGPYWINTKEFKNLIQDKEAFGYYLGLLEKTAEVRYANVQFNANLSLVSVLEQTNNIQAWQDYVGGFLRKSDRLINIIRDYKKQSDDSLALEQYYNYFKASIDLLEYAAHADALPGLKDSLPHLSDSLALFFDAANTAADMTLDIHRKNYAAAITNATHLYSLIKVQHEDKSKRQVMEKLFRYGSFMASVAMAKSSDEVALAIEAASLPTGSSRIKRETRFNVSLNAYVGPYIGSEKIRGAERHFKSAYGLSVPIGIAISRGHAVLPFLGVKGWEEGKRGWSSSVFFSLIDLGALASFRFTESQTIMGKDTISVHDSPNIKLKNIISPGIFLSVGIPRSPLSVNMGVQSGPALRNITVDNGTGQAVATYEDKTYLRWSLSLVVDIPLMNFYTKPDK